jgi:hypothetical protein
VITIIAFGAAAGFAARWVFNDKGYCKISQRLEARRVGSWPMRRA